jgi:hypothetical protein
MENLTDEILTVVEINFATGERIERELNQDELDQRQLDQAEVAAQQSEADAKAAARKSALAKLKKLGLTAAEIEAL